MSDGRWYDSNGVCPVVLNKKGEIKKITVVDARKLGLRPSVTSVLSLLDKPGIDRWKVRVAVEAALTLPRIDGESLDDFLARAIEDAGTLSKKAAEFGTNIHKMITSFLTRNMYNAVDKRTEDIMQPMIAWIKANELDGVSEKFMLCDTCAGTADFIGAMKLNGETRNVIIDFKTQQTKEGESATYYPEHLYQLCGYLYLLYQQKVEPRNHALVNVIISTTEPRRIEHREWSELDTERGIDIFKLAVQLFRKIKNL